MLSVLKWLAIIILALGAFCVLWFCFKSRKPIRYLLINFAVSAAAFMVINLTEKYTGIRIPVNYFTVTASAVFGVPAVIALLVLRLIFVF